MSRKIYPNVDFYSGLLYQAMGFAPAMFPVLFAIGRTAGWVAQWEEMLRDDTRKIARPRQIYVGESERDYVPTRGPLELERALTQKRAKPSRRRQGYGEQAGFLLTSAF